MTKDWSLLNQLDIGHAPLQDFATDDDESEDDDAVRVPFDWHTLNVTSVPFYVERMKTR